MQSGYAIHVAQVTMSGMQTLGELVRAARQAKGWNQRQLSDALGRDTSYVSRLETDQAKETPTPESLDVLRRVLGLSNTRMLEALGYLKGPSEPEQQNGPKAHLQAVIDQFAWDWGQALHLGEIIRAYGNLPDAEQVSRIAMTYHNHEPAPLTDDPYYRQGPPREDDPTNAEE